jgi:hypothetical protein
MDFPEGIRERGPLFAYTFALVRHPHLDHQWAKANPALEGRRGRLTQKSETLVAAVTL